MKTEKTEKIAAEKKPPTDAVWLIGCLIVTATAVLLRFWRLDLKPLHHDEGVNGFFLTTLFREGVYKYDPANYHGPDLYYFALAAAKIFGLNTYSIRGSVAIFGVLTVVAVFFLKDHLGKTGSLAAALLVALSPGMVYISRYFIHEIAFVFFSFGIVLGVLFFIEKRRAGAVAMAAMTLLLLVCFLPTVLNLANVVAPDGGNTQWLARLGLFAVESVLVFLIMRMIAAWNGGAPVYLLLAAASAALLFATKETAFITVGTLAAAVVSVWLWRKIYRGFVGKPAAEDCEPTALTWTVFRQRLGSSSDVILITVAAVCLFAFVGILFFSSFFTYPEGIGKAFEAYALWTKTGSKDHTQNGTFAYVRWLGKIELPIMILAVVGFVIALVKANRRFALFVGFWAFGLFAAYTIIPYKTPWLALSFLLPMCLVAGYGINEMIADRRKHIRISGVILISLAAFAQLYQTYDLNFVRYDDDSMPYVYAHTKRGFLDLIERIKHYAEKSGKDKDVSVEIVSPDYWSMPWYLRDYPKAVFHGSFVDATTAEMIVASEAQAAQLDERYGAHYKIAGKYPLRPGVELYLLVRDDLADAGAKNISQIGEFAP